MRVNWRDQEDESRYEGLICIGRSAVSEAGSGKGESEMSTPGAQTALVKIGIFYACRMCEGYLGGRSYIVKSFRKGINPDVEPMRLVRLNPMADREQIRNRHAGL